MRPCLRPSSPICRNPVGCHVFEACRTKLLSATSGASKACCRHRHAFEAVPVSPNETCDRGPESMAPEMPRNATHSLRVSRVKNTSLEPVSHGTEADGRSDPPLFSLPPGPGLRPPGVFTGRLPDYLAPINGVILEQSLPTFARIACGRMSSVVALTDFAAA
jgi:hypothetical protein